MATLPPPTACSLASHWPCWAAAGKKKKISSPPASASNFTSASAIASLPQKRWSPFTTTPTSSWLTPSSSSKTVSSVPTSPPLPKNLCGGSSEHRVSVLTVVVCCRFKIVSRPSLRERRGISLLFGFRLVRSVHGTIYRNPRNVGYPGGRLRILHRSQSHQAQDRSLGSRAATPARFFCPAFRDGHQTFRLPRQRRQQAS